MARRCAGGSPRALGLWTVSLSGVWSSYLGGSYDASLVTFTIRFQSLLGHARLGVNSPNTKTKLKDALTKAGGPS